MTNGNSKIALKIYAKLFESTDFKNVISKYLRYNCNFRVNNKLMIKLKI